MTQRRQERIRTVVSQRQRDLIVVLEDLHDPHNAEAIFRSCDAFGVQQVWLIFDQEKPFSPKKIGKASSASANKWLDFTIFSSTKTALTKLKRAGFELLATVIDARGESIFQAQLTQKEKLALLVGNEYRGLSPVAQELADRLITIPMRGMVQSLNVSVATAIFLFEITRQRGKTGKNWSLSPEDQVKLVADFSQR